MVKLSALLAVTVALVLLLLAFATPAAACNTTYCSSRGVGAASATGEDGCGCQCDWPYFGYRCRYSFTDDAASTITDCSGDPQLRVSEVLCNSSKQCFWNASESACRSKILPWYALVNASGNLASLVVPTCYRVFTLPLQITVYAFASGAFGVGGVGFFYMLRYRHTYSIVDDNGERTFNQFYSNPWPTLIYSFLLFISSGMLGITAYINFRDPTVCAFVAFFWIYIAVQALALLWVVKWMIEWCMRRYTSPEKKMVQIDRYVRPMTQEILDATVIHGNKPVVIRGSKLRCF